ncbi:hypothetical protein [Alkalibacillus haloalkaliphilus]|uniref:Uncharacterized protein n=1 Tax=Alkalibacillus haloalkaliphilus TaxID=94136 RepID=A0A511W2G8_9BACI|nr:hypothetical protein [Alkalibacillus haloalkaliphilus]GEN45240.1 hypothetical protein AHA02nite_10160 [Alkalibacillus haloalkaliphilus]
MKRSFIGLLTGVLFVAMSFVTAMAMYWVLFFLLDVRLHSYIGPPYVDVIIYFNFLIIVLGLFLSIGIAIYIHKAYPNDIIKSSFFILITFGISFVICSWYLIEFYNNADYFRGFIPPVTERYPLPWYGYQGLHYYIMNGMFLCLIQLLSVSIGSIFKKYK